MTALLGFVYWWFVTRLFPLEAVGFASAIISAMQLLGTISVLGLGTLLIGELPRQPGNAGSLISGALIIVGGVAGGLGIAFAIFAPFLSADFLPLRANIGSVLLFALGVSLTTITVVFDQALIGLLRGELQLWRNLLFSIIKIVALFAISLWATLTTGLAIYTTWTIANGLSLLSIVVFFSLKRRWSSSIYRPQWKVLRKLGPAAIQHHILNLMLIAPVQILPIIVTAVLSVKANAWFYVALGLSGLSAIFPVALTTVLYAESVQRSDELMRKIRLTLSLSFVIGLLAALVLWFGASLILSLFGPSYAHEAQWCLRILSLEAFPVMIRNHYVAVRRIQDRTGSAILPIMIIGAFQLICAVIGAHLADLSGLSIGWLGADCVGAIYMLPVVLRVAFPEHAAS